MLAALAQSESDWFWYTIGFGGQIAFGSRFLVQWLASERARRSVVPLMFWYLSLAGSLLLLAYSIRQEDAVFITGQSSGFLVYCRNLYLIRVENRADRSGKTS